MKIKISKEQLDTFGKLAKKGCKFVLYGVVTALSYTSATDILKMMQDDGDVGYSDAVNAIMDSFMCSSDKSEAVAVLARNGNAEFYKAVIEIAGSMMCSSDKVETIRKISNNN